MKEIIEQIIDDVNIIMMVDNFLPSFDMTEQIAINPEKKVEEHIATIKADIEGHSSGKPKGNTYDGKLSDVHGMYSSLS